MILARVFTVMLTATANKVAFSGTAVYYGPGVAQVTILDRGRAEPRVGQNNIPLMTRNRVQYSERNGGKA